MFKNLSSNKNDRWEEALMRITENEPAGRMSGAIQKTSRDETMRSDPRQAVVRHYSEAGPDYAEWSPDYNMHFGYYARGMNPFRLEPMLRRMTEEILCELEADLPDADTGAMRNPRPRVLDAGCGVGAGARYALRSRPDWRVTGVTVVPWQIDMARKLTAADRELDRLARENAEVEPPCYLLQDYTDLGFKDNEFDGAYAMESLCYAPGPDKGDALRELHRVLRPGARLVVGDGFYKKRPARGPLRACFQAVERRWALECFASIEPFVERMREIGFREIKIRDVSWRVAPSALFVPWVSARFLLRNLSRGRLPSRAGREHLVASLLAPIIGAARGNFAYCIVSGVK